MSENEGPGWFAIDGVQDGRRTVAEQMLGLHPALAEARGKSVADIGCAEGCIAIEFAKAGAASVYACDNQVAMIEKANALAAEMASPPKFHLKDLRDLIKEEHGGGAQYDIVLALAIVHKVDDPKAALEFMADSARELVVIRLPKDYPGILISKHSGQPCDVARVMTRRGFALEKTIDGPRRELVAYWRRKR